MFVFILSRKFHDQELDKTLIIKKLSITSKQLDNWFKLAIDEQIIIKTIAPVRYKLNPNIKFHF